MVLRESRAVLERQDEAAALDEGRAAAVRANGVAFSIEGPAGIGKTTLLEYAADEARAGGFTVLEARGAEVETAYPFGIVQTLFGRFLAGLPDEERAVALAGTSDVAAAIFGPSSVGSAPGQEGLPGALHGLFWLAVNLSASTPLAIVVDDAHWADHASRRWIEYLARRLDGLRVLLLVGARNDELHARYSTPDGAAPLTPAPLTEGGARALLQHRLELEVGPGFADATRRVTGGIPLLIEQLAAAIAERGWSPTDDRAAALDDFGPPETAEFTLRRLERLGADATAVAEAVAVLGPAVTPDLTAELAGLDRATVASTADALVEGGLFARDRPLAFVHPIIEAATRNSIPSNRQGLMHRRAADLLLERGAAPVRVAQHLIETEPNDDPEVVRVLREAAAEAAARGALDVAVAALTRARAEPPPAGEAAGVTLELGRCRLVMGDPGALSLLKEAIDTAPDAPTKAMAALAMAPALLVADRLEEAIVVLENALAGLGDDAPELAVQLEIELLSSAHLKQMDHGSWEKRVRRLAGVLDAVPAPLRRAALGHLAQHAAFEGRRPEEVRDLALEALAGGLLLAEQTADSPAYYFAASALVLSEDYRLSRDALTAAREEAERRGSPVGFAFASTFRALPNLRLGDLDAAEADSLEGLRVADEHDLALARPGAVIWLTEALVTRGRLDEADELLQRYGLDGDLPSSTWFLHLYEKRGSLRLAQGRFDEALTDLREAGRRNYAVGDRSVTDVFWRSYAAQALMGLRQRDEARALAEEEVRLAREFGGRYSIGRALFGLAATHTDGEAGLELLREAREGAAATSAPVLEARAAVAEGAMLRRLGRTAAAREILRDGLDLATRLGLAPVARWARDELKAAGGRALSRPSSGLAALTPSELRIAHLAGSGSSNREIARALFVTQKTVETHLTAVYSKLGISSRRELPAEMRDASPPA